MDEKRKIGGIDVSDKLVCSSACLGQIRNIDVYMTKERPVSWSLTLGVVGI
jgi:cell fate regulator YaaT (PSP1 superfamily)